MSDTVRIPDDEQQHLNEVLNHLRYAKDKYEHQGTQYDKDVRDGQQFIWQHRGDMDGAEKAATRLALHQTAQSGVHVAEQLRRIEKLLPSPYFGRVDFRFGSDREAVPHYIGLFTHERDEDGAILIYDWRAPVSSLFYDHERGNASYEAPAGRISGHIERKRQFKIQNGQMKFMVDTDVHIGDELLLEELSGSAGDRMKNIVVSIQREQNAVIRDPSGATLIVQGVAGSGKTSIALHRVAFLLYRFRGRLSSDRVMILSPNKVFADYISTVLPELGEDPILEAGMEDIARHCGMPDGKAQQFYDQISDLIRDRDSERIRRIRHKASEGFADRLAAFLETAADTFFQPKDLRADGVRMTAKQILESYRSFPTLPVLPRLIQTARDVTQRAELDLERTLPAAVKQQIRKGIRGMFAFRDDRALYRHFCTAEGADGALKVLRGHPIPYEDLFPLLLVRTHMESIEPFEKIRHLVIDEMQDYTPVQYRLIRRLFSCDMTILGDRQQAVNPYSSSTLERLARLFPDARCLELNTSYRSSWEISRVADAVLPNRHLVAVKRHGDLPAITSLPDRQAEVRELRRLVRRHLREEDGVMGVLCRDDDAADRLYRDLTENGKERIYRLDHHSDRFGDGVLIMTVPLAKGLEFDHVVVPSADDTTYRDEMDRHLLYVACTRALHRLDLIHSGPVSRWLEDAVRIGAARTTAGPDARG